MSCLRSSALAKMFPHVMLTMLIICLVSGSTIAQEVSKTGTLKLRWVNGDELTGLIVSATDSHLLWQSEALSQALSVDLRTLHSIEADDLDRPVDLSSNFRIRLINGDTWSGDLQSIDAEHVVLTSARHGEVSIKRQWVDRLIRTGLTAPIDLTGTKAQGWLTVSPSWEQNTELAHWKTDNPEEIATTSPGSRLFHPSSLPELCDIELLIESTKRPSFSLALGSLSKLQARTGNLEFETWGDELIVQADSASAEFTPLMRLKPETRRVHLRAFWNRVEGKLTVHDMNGQMLADVSLNPTDATLEGGILLENKGTDLTIKALRVSSWNGKSPSLTPAVDRAKSQPQQRVRTMDGLEYYGQISGPDDNGQWVIQSGQDETVQIATDQLAEVLSARAAEAEPTTRVSELKYFDGSLLHGELLGITEGTATLKVPYSEKPLPADLSGLKAFTFPVSETQDVPTSDHVLEYQGMELHGTLAPAETKLGWRLVGAEDVIPLDLDRPLRIRRVNEATEDEPNSQEHPGVVYLANGDQLPCRVESIDGEFMTLATEFRPLIKMSTADVKAIAFGASRPDEIVGFKHPRWNISNNRANAIERSDKEIVFRGNGSVTHPDLLATGYCEFVATWPKPPGAYLMLTVQQEPVGGRGQMIRQLGGHQQSMAYIMHSNDRIMAHVQSGHAGRQATIEANEKDANLVEVRIQQDDDRLVLFANGQKAGTLATLDESTRVTGMSISCQQINGGNRPKRVRAADNGKEAKPLLTLSDMRAGRAAGLFAMVHIGETSRKHALTVPRSRRNNPPKHLLVSQTGDLLRGELLSVAPTNVLFRAGFDEVAIPRDRLAGIVWLNEPVVAGALGEETPTVDQSSPDATPSSPQEGQVQAVFPNGVTLHVQVDQVDGDVLVGTHDIFGECRLSLNKVNELRIGAVTEEMQQVAFSDWTLVPAREPVIPDPNADPSFGTFSTLVGEQAEDFQLELLNGEPFQLSEHQGKVVVLDFWATWCGPCIRSIPDLLEATSAYSPDDVVFVGVNHQENAALIRRVLNDHAWDFTVALDRDGEISRKYLVEGFPQTVIIGREGRIEHVHLGASSNLHDKLTEIIDGLLTAADAPAE